MLAEVYMTTSTRGASIVSSRTIQSEICEKVAAMVGVASGDLDPREPLQRYGVSSAQAILGSRTVFMGDGPHDCVTG